MPTSPSWPADGGAPPEIGSVASMGVLLRRSFLAIGLAAVVLLLAAAPAGAAPAKPGDFRSTVTRLTPPNSAVELKVVGGDGFLQVKVEPGHDVVVQGYDGESWLHIRPDGVV